MPQASAPSSLLVLLVGAPGTGKSTLAARLAVVLQADLIQSDRVRKQLFSEPRYTGGEHGAVYGWCHNLLRSSLQLGRRVLFDATNLEERNRRRVYDIADACGARLLIVWTASPSTLVQQRLLRRKHEPDAGDQSDADWEVYLTLWPKADPIRRPHMVVNTATSLDSLVTRIVAYALA